MPRCYVLETRPECIKLAPVYLELKKSTSALAILRQRARLSFINQNPQCQTTQTIGISLLMICIKPRKRPPSLRQILRRAYNHNTNDVFGTDSIKRMLPPIFLRFGDENESLAPPTGTKSAPIGAISAFSLNAVSSFP